MARATWHAWVIAGWTAAMTAGCADGDMTCLGNDHACSEGAASDAFDPSTPLSERVAALHSDLAPGSRGREVQTVQEYLANFGYLPNVALAEQYPAWRAIVTQEPAPGIYDAVTVSAVREYQRYAGLEQTGNVNEAVRALMSAPRCGVPDSAETGGTDGTIEKFALYPGWTRGVTVSWKVVGATSHNGSSVNPVTSPAPGAGETVNSLLQREATAAFNIWSSAATINFARETTAADANIHIRWHEYLGDSPLGDAEPPHDTGDGIADIRVNTTSRTWSVDGTVNTGQTDLQSLLLHEIGHAIGLQHSSIGNNGNGSEPTIDAVMNSGLSPNQLMRTLHVDDAVAVSTLYDTWDQLSGGATAIDVGNNGSTWILGASSASGGYLIYQRIGSNWVVTKNTSGLADNFRAHRIAVDASGIPWVVQPNTGNVFKRTTGTATSGSWTAVPGACATDIDVGADGSVWIVGCSGDFLGIRKLNGASWSAAIGSQASRIAVDSHGIPWVVFNNNTIERRTTNLPTTGAWDVVPGAALDIAAGPAFLDDSGAPVSYVYVVDNFNVSGGHNLHVWNEQSQGDGDAVAPTRSEWVQIDGAGVAISVGPDGNPWVVDSSNNIHKRLR